MAKILHVDSSSRSDDSLTRRLSKYLVEQLTKAHPTDTVVYEDLIQESPGPLTADSIAAMFVPAEQRTEAMSADYAKLLATNLQQIKDADIYVFGVPMYNFSVPGVFKNYIDRIVIKDHTFAYGEGGFKGLLENKKAYVIRSSGGNYALPPYSSMDFHEPYLRTIFGFIGITDVTFINVFGHSEEEIGTAVKEAKEQIDLVATGQKLVTSAR